MPSFSAKSKRILDTVHPDLAMVMHMVIQDFDFTIISGHRGQLEQTQIFNAGNSKTPWPKSKHNKNPSLAVDIAPYPVDWNNADRFIYLAGHVMATARGIGVELRWGGDWMRNNMRTENKFKDLGHFELWGIDG